MFSEKFPKKFPIFFWAGNWPTCGTQKSLFKTRRLSDGNELGDYRSAHEYSAHFAPVSRYAFPNVAILFVFFCVDEWISSAFEWNEGQERPFCSNRINLELIDRIDRIEGASQTSSINWLLFGGIGCFNIPFDSSLNALSKIFWVQFDQTKRSTAN